MPPRHPRSERNRKCLTQSFGAPPLKPARAFRARPSTPRWRGASFPSRCGLARALSAGGNRTWPAGWKAGNCGPRDPVAANGMARPCGGTQEPARDCRHATAAGIADVARPEGRRQFPGPAGSTRSAARAASSAEALPPAQSAPAALPDCAGGRRAKELRHRFGSTPALRRIANSAKDELKVQLLRQSRPRADAIRDFPTGGRRHGVCDFHDLFGQ